jgi:hypothetical protein
MEFVDTLATLKVFALIPNHQSFDENRGMRGKLIAKARGFKLGVN